MEILEQLRIVRLLLQNRPVYNQRTIPSSSYRNNVAEAWDEMQGELEVLVVIVATFVRMPKL